MLTELHCHTNFSKQRTVYHEGMNTPEEIVEFAKSIGIEVICITDHDTTLGHKRAVKAGKQHEILVIPSEEITSLDGHILGIGINETIKPGLSAEETVDLIHEQGGVAISPHAFDIKRVGIGEKAMICDAMEGFNALNLDRLTNRRCRVFAEKHNMPQVAGSDAHWLPMMGYGLTEIQGDSIDAILKSIKTGHVEIKVAKYQPVNVLMYWSLSRLQMSYDYIFKYLDDYPFYKRFLYRKILSLVNRSPGKIDYFFKGMAYFSFAAVIAYSGAREITRL